MCSDLTIKMSVRPSHARQNNKEVYPNYESTWFVSSHQPDTNLLPRHAFILFQVQVWVKP